MSSAEVHQQDDLKRDLRDWWNNEVSDWDALVLESTDDKLLVDEDGGDLWDRMPEVDSKAVARSSPIFERHLGVPLDVKLIRRGGYASFEAMVDDLVPKMIQLVTKGTQTPSRRTDR